MTTKAIVIRMATGAPVFVDRETLRQLFERVIADGGQVTVTWNAEGLEKLNRVMVEIESS